jgi:hypothetical protein
MAYENEEVRVCKVYDRDDVFTLLVQIVLALFALGSLYFKRLQEVPRRTFQTWFLDVSKQGIGACYAHVLNMVRFYCAVEIILFQIQKLIRFIQQ